MNITVDAIDMAAEIIKFGLSSRKGQPSRRLLPLMAAYLANTDGTRTAAKTMAQRFGLSITSVTEDGVVLSKDPEHDDSIFMSKRDDIVKDPGPEARLIRGICNAAILACAYQRQQALYSESVQTITSDEVYELLVEAAAKMNLEQIDVPTSLRGLTEAAKIVERIKADSFSEKAGNPRKQTLRGQINTALKYFTDHGLMLKDSEDAGGTYKTLPELRVRLQTQGAQDIADAVLSAIKASSSDEAMKEAMNG